MKVRQLLEIRDEKESPLFWTLIMNALKKGTKVYIRSRGADGEVTMAEPVKVTKQSTVHFMDAPLDRPYTVHLRLVFNGSLTRDPTVKTRRHLLPPDSDEHLTLKPDGKGGLVIVNRDKTKSVEEALDDEAGLPLAAKLTKKLLDKGVPVDYAATSYLVARPGKPFVQELQGRIEKIEMQQSSGSLAVTYKRDADRVITYIRPHHFDALNLKKSDGHWALISNSWVDKPEWLNRTDQ